MIAENPEPISGALVTVDSTERRMLTAEQFQGLANVPPELEWFANIKNAKTKKAYREDITDFRLFVGIERPEEFRIVTRSHIIAWRDDIERRQLFAGNCLPSLLYLSIYVTKTPYRIIRSKA